ncbi:MAG: sulfatase-like hydrolase/transferase, partial [Vicinamibacterales bacterium]
MRAVNLTRLAIAVIAGIVVACAGKPPGGPVATNASVLLVTIDTLRADRVSSAGLGAGGRSMTPEIDALAASGVRFTAARANAPLTLPSHVTIMTGALPPAHGVRENGSRFDGSRAALAGLLDKRGYRTGAFVGAFVLDASFGLNGGFDVYDDRIPRDSDAPSALEAERPARAVVDAALAWLVAPSDRSQPFFLWAHLYDPHAPYAPPEPFASRFRDEPYLGEVAATDAFLAPLLGPLLDGKEPPALV